LQPAVPMAVGKPRRKKQMANKTKKSLALASSLALVGAALTASPAHAVDPVVLEVNAGTSYNVFAQEQVVLKAAFTDAGQAAAETLKWKIVDASSKLDIDLTRSDDDETLVAEGTADEVKGVKLDANKTEVIDSAEKTAGDMVYLHLVPDVQAAGSEASFDVVVTAWMDFDGDDVVDAGEASQTRTVSFKKYSDVSLSWTVKDAEFGTNALKAEAVTSPKMNTNYIASVTATADGDAVVAEKASTEGSFVVSDTAVAPLGAGDTTFALIYNAKEVGKTTVTLADPKVNSLTSAITDTEDTTAAGKVRTGTTSGSVVFTVKDADGDALGAGIRVDVTIDNSTTKAVVGADDTLTVAGKSVADGDDVDVTVSYTTNSAGQVVVPFSSKLGKAGNTFAIKATANGEPVDAKTVVWEDAAYTAMSIAQNVALHASYEVTVADGSSIPVAFKVEDQFGKAAPANTYFVSVARSGGDGRATTAGSATAVAEFSGSLASATIVDNGSGNGEDIYTGTLTKRNSDGTTAATGVTATVTANFNSSITYALSFKEDSDADGIDDAVALSDNVGTLTGTEALSNADLGKVVDSVGDVQAIEVATGVAGSQVTLSAANVGFKVDGKSVYGYESISLNTDSNGKVIVHFYSNTSGAKSIVVSAGNKSATLKTTFAAAANTAGATLSWDAPDYVKPGSTLKITAKLVDKYGNAVASDRGFRVSYSGPGLQVGSDPIAYGTDGEAVLSYLLGSNDEGTITVSFEYDSDNGADPSTTDTLTVSKTITIGTAPAANTKVNAGSFKGYVAIYAKGHQGKRLSAKVGKDWVVVPALASNFVRVVEYTGAGYTIAVRIYIDRVLVDTITVVTK